MDKVVIIGVFDFVNFHVCKALLDKGIEVKGVQIETEENGDLLVEKRLEIGRNANFSVISIGELTDEHNQKGTMVLSVYDLYMQYQEDFLLSEDIKKPFMNFNNWEKIVILAPSQLVTNENITEAGVIMLNFMKGIKSLANNIQFLYLPTIYGPWQPDTFMFQHSILNEWNGEGTFRGLREEITDALFVEDAVASIIEIVEKNSPGRYLLQSGKNNQWEQCAAFLGIGDHISNQSTKELVDNEINKLSVKSIIPLPDALTKQIEHTHRVYI
ncbi:hypothetical protein [Bacillus sp. OK048]|uniref:hypothetical protein n=1 Tax=Bacillus sp. OK048 TaxID=1882761 RepID=UPI00088458BA|nr:hypothetical protein [Bacillus sp. OK048]SDN14531.1 hypothetical protein SAMN05443253_108200 [Bacillus sp. OK048]